MKRTWYFIDIDGCCMPNIFNNQFYKNDKEKLKVIAKVYQNVINEDINLYPQFIEWYKRIFDGISFVYFITGRQKDVFGFLTRYQLQPIKKYFNFEIVYFPKYSNHNWIIYKDFKNESISKILSEEIMPEDIIKIYDDIDFLEDSLKLALREYEFHQITKPEDWEKL